MMTLRGLILVIALQAGFAMLVIDYPHLLDAGLQTLGGAGRLLPR